MEDFPIRPFNCYRQHPSISDLFISDMEEVERDIAIRYSAKDFKDTNSFHSIFTASLLSVIKTEIGIKP